MKDIFPSELLLFIFEITLSRNKFQKSFKYRTTLHYRTTLLTKFAHVPFDFISLYLFVLTFAMKLRN